jgi:competence protein ComEC
VSLALLLWHPFAPQTILGQLEMTAIDVGQGDSILIAFPDGKRMLMDGGGIPAFGRQARSQLDIGEDVVAPYLWERSVRGVDVIALSHAHEDHIGGLPALISDFRPKELWTRATPESPRWRAVREAAVRNHVRILPMQAGNHITFGGAELDVLAPLPDYVPLDEPKNNDSLVMRLQYGRNSFLLCGDIERPVENGLLERLQHVDVLKVAHHGSRTSSTEQFLEAVNPMYAVISVGYLNSYGHPNRDVLDRLRQHHAVILRTDEEGLVTIHSDGKRLRVQTYRNNPVMRLDPALFP